MRYEFKNNGQKYCFFDDWCGGGNHLMVHYSSVMDDLKSIEFIIEEETVGTIFKRKVQKYYIDLKYKKFFYDKELSIKRICIDSSEKHRAIEVCTIVAKKLEEIAEEKRAKEQRKADELRKKKEAELARIEKLRSIDKSKIVCLDVETTGLNKEKDEILQLSIINGNGEVLFNEYIKPKKRTSWKSAEAIHGISPTTVKGKSTIDCYIPQLNSIFETADLIVGYNSNGFDIDFIKNVGVIVPKTTLLFDVMLEFAPIYGKWDEYHGNFKWQKLATCAKYYGYKFKAHDALEDVRATLHCYYSMLEKM